MKLKDLMVSDNKNIMLNFLSIKMYSLINNFVWQ